MTAQRPSSAEAPSSTWSLRSSPPPTPAQLPRAGGSGSSSSGSKELGPWYRGVTAPPQTTPQPEQFQGHWPRVWALQTKAGGIRGQNHFFPSRDSGLSLGAYLVPPQTLPPSLSQWGEAPCTPPLPPRIAPCLTFVNGEK